VSVIALLRRHGFRELMAGQTVSALGDWMGTVAFMALALRQSGSPTAVGVILALRLLPGALGGPLAARAAGRWDRRRTMLAMDATRAGIIAAIPLVRGLWPIYLGAFSLELASLVFLPARDAAIPDLVDEEQLPLANGLVLASSYGTIPLGAAAFAAVTALPVSDVLDRPFALVFWVDALSFLVSLAFVARLTELSGGPLPRSPGEAPIRFSDAFAIPLVRGVMPAAAAVALGLGALFSLGIVFVREVLHATEAEFGLLIALFGVGAGAGLAVLQAQQKRDALLQARLGVAVIGGIVAGFSLSPALWVAYFGAGAFGGAAAYTLASGMGVIQSELFDAQRVLAFAAFHVVIRVGLAAAAIGAGAAGELVGSVRWPVVGRLESSRLVLLCSGLLVFVSSTFVRRGGAIGEVVELP